MDTVAIGTFIMGLIKSGAWMPLMVAILIILTWLFFKTIKQESENNRTDAKKREELLMEFVKENNAKSEKREAELKEQSDRNEAEAREREKILLDHLQKTERVNNKMVNTLERIQTRMEYIERAVNIDSKIMVNIDPKANGS